MEGMRDEQAKLRAMKMAGLCCLAVAVWLGFSAIYRTKDDGGVFSARAEEGAKRPFVTKRERETPRRLTAGEVREKFDADRKRGMTEQEVRWVVEDLAAAGIDNDDLAVDTAEGYYEIRKKRERWYLDMLVEVLGLSPEQHTQAAASLRKLGEDDFVEFQKYLESAKPVNVDGKVYQIIDGSKARRLMDAGIWLNRKEASPWSLCELSEEQRMMIEEDLFEGDEEPSIKVAQILSAGTIFPLSPEQLEKAKGTNDGDFLARLRLLAPYQLKTILLLSPGFSEDIREALDS